ncbi:hypothetical protein AA0481_2411 [Acetobacter orientalis NRIC 0481]|uniref:Uncharacterized protein n=1 Tax=Acetobacter orientalis TaxID=146474 RepID=A0A0D6NGT5_9PROT|nr:hypothetical protein Abor_001_080 [Acetobacter orientalis]GBR21560.1 hypothetical protein AA0481_2411 [Acetobacter orientalis NRIC 0481]GEL62153.1 hypothetical protein AOR02nite_19950 [Acetobacter orientalis]
MHMLVAKPMMVVVAAASLCVFIFVVVVVVVRAAALLVCPFRHAGVATFMRMAVCCLVCRSRAVRVCLWHSSRCGGGGGRVRAWGSMRCFGWRTGLLAGRFDHKMLHPFKHVCNGTVALGRCPA